MIVLSDGLTDKADFHALVSKMARDGITVSTVSVGSDADVQLMADIAKDGKGRGYVALDPQTIPQIFTTETLLISRDLLIEKTVTPSIVTPERAAQRHCAKQFAGAARLRADLSQTARRVIDACGERSAAGFLALRSRPGDGVSRRI